MVSKIMERRDVGIAVEKDPDILPRRRGCPARIFARLPIYRAPKCARF